MPPPDQSSVSPTKRTLNVLVTVRDVDDNVKKMVLATPGLELGQLMKRKLVNAIKIHTPGHHYQLFGTGKAFIEIFFPGVTKELYVDDAAVTGFTDWSGFAVALLCQSMNALTSGLKQQLKTDDISNAVNSYNDSVHFGSYKYYSFLLARCNSEFKTPFDATANKASAKEEYIKTLKEGVNIHDLWYTSGIWKNPHWEMFHHYMKLQALGASDAEIDQLITELVALGLPDAATLGNGAWKTFGDYRVDAISHEDIDDAARDGILRVEYVQNFSSGMLVEIKEKNSYEFTANGQPGSTYRGGTNSCCFSASTHVMMSDCSWKRITDVVPGDQVYSRHGNPRTVALIATPPRSNRVLFCINNTVLCTESHPFVIADVTAGGHSLCAISPNLLSYWVPAYAIDGVASLKVGMRLAGPFKRAVNITSIEAQPVEGDDGDETLFDLVLVPEGDVANEYIVGTDTCAVVATSEIPLLVRVPHATKILLRVFHAALPLFHCSSDRDSCCFDLGSKDKFLRQMEAYRLNLCTDVIPIASAEAHAAATKKEVQTLETVDPDDVMAHFLNPSDHSYNWCAGRFYDELVSALGNQLEDAVAFGYRSFSPEGATPGAILALDISSVHVHDECSVVDPKNLVALHITLEIGGVKKGTAVVKETVARCVNTHRSSQPYLRFFDDTVYFDITDDELSASRKVLFELKRDDAPDTEAALLSGFTMYPDELKHQYWHSSPTLTSKVHDECSAELLVSTRLLADGAVVTAEKAAKGIYTSEEAEAFGNALANSMTRLVLSRLTENVVN